VTVQPLVLAVDDEARVLQFIKLELSSQDFRVITAQNGVEALRMVEEQRPDLVLLDVIMPDMSGLEVMRRLRETSSVPIILLTARNRDQDKIRGLDMGADDYLAKPFNPEELSARVRAILRRGHPPAAGEESIVRSGAIEIDLAKRLVKKHGEVVSLTRTEWMLLQFLAANAGRVILNAELLTRVWGSEYSNDLQYLRVWVSRLRSKLGDDSSNHQIIRTLPGVGYMLIADEDDDTNGATDGERQVAETTA
jgi:two-component system KDP operon response regulator KdpE